jgi:hypothetical protein
MSLKKSRLRPQKLNKGTMMNTWIIIVIIGAIALGIFLPIFNYMRFSDIFLALLQLIAIPLLTFSLGLLLILWNYKKRTMVGAKFWTKPLTIILLIITIFSGSITVYLGATGQLTFGALPEEPPEEFQVGYSKIILVNQQTNETINGNLHLFLYSNHTNYRNITTNTVFYVPNSTYAYITVNDSRYYNQTVAVFARDDVNNPYVTTYYTNIISPVSEVDLKLIAINNTYGSYGVGDITDGHHILTFQIVVNPPFDSNTSLGNTYFYPIGFIENNSYIANYSNNRIGLWIRWEGNIANVNDHTFITDVYECGIYNVTTKLFPVFGGEETWIFEADFNSITNMTIYYGTLDDSQTPSYILTLS